MLPDNWPAVEEKGGSIVHGLFRVAAGNGLRPEITVHEERFYIISSENVPL